MAKALAVAAVNSQIWLRPTDPNDPVYVAVEALSKEAKLCAGRFLSPNLLTSHPS
jgi:hypothetical protein